MPDDAPARLRRTAAEDPDFSIMSALIDHVAAELGLVPRPDTRDGYVWNGYPVSFQILNTAESSEPSSVVVEICTRTPGNQRTTAASGLVWK